MGDRVERRVQVELGVLRERLLVADVIGKALRELRADVEVDWTTLQVRVERLPGGGEPRFEIVVTADELGDQR